MAALLLLAAGMTACSASPEQPAMLATPPMGWSSWNRFGCAVDQAAVLRNADALVSSGMAAAGYQYVNIDDCWMAPQRDADGRLQADPVRFPMGIKAIADYVHSKGLKLGIYQSAGTLTCQNLPGSLDHEATDAQTFADWGVDLLKYDNCNAQGRPTEDRFRTMSDALSATGRDIVLMMCDWGDSKPWTWAKSIGAKTWRTYGDIEDTWDSMTGILDHQVGLESYSGPDGWNDPDSLEVGNGGMTTEEYRAQMSLWALLNAPLMAGNDLSAMDSVTRELLTNRAVLAVNQDWKGVQGRRVRADGPSEVWAKPLSTGEAAVVLFNRGDAAETISVSPSELGLPEATVYSLRDLWTDKVVFVSTVSVSVPGHAARMFRVSPPGA